MSRFRKFTADPVRFWARVDRRGDDECWPFNGSIDRWGYGRFGAQLPEGGQYQVPASRVAWQMANQRHPDGIVCHSCDNPRCCNPAHLWLGTVADNVRDAASKGRVRGQALTHCANGHEFTPDNTYRRPGTITGRDCRACVRARVARYKPRRQARAALAKARGEQPPA